MYRYESWTIEKAEHWRIDAFELWYWRKLLGVHWTARRSNQSIIKEINPEYSLKELMFKLKLQYVDHLMQRATSSNQQCHSAISSSVVPFTSCLQSLPASESFPMNQLFAWSGQSIGVSASASVLPMNIWTQLSNWTTATHGKISPILPSKSQIQNRVICCIYKLLGELRKRLSLLQTLDKLH